MRRGCSSCIKLYEKWKKFKRIKKLSLLKDDQKNFEKKKLTIALNVLYLKKMGICPVSASKHNSSREKQVTLLMIPNREG